MRILYIAGYGRSGSTFLDRTLGSFPGVVSCGEIAYYHSRARVDGHLCGCGSPVNQCELWSEIDKKYVGNISDQKELDIQLLKGLEKKLGQNAVIVDSSKTAYGQMRRPFRLRAAGHKVVPILIWRMPGEVLRSRSAARYRSGRSKSNSSISVFDAFKGSLGWTLSNIAGLWVIFRLNGKLVAFNDFVDSPIRTAELFLSEESLKRSQILNDESHLIVGNRMRSKRLSDIATSEPRPELEGIGKLPVFVLCKPLAIYLSYLSKRKSVTGKE